MPRVMEAPVATPDGVSAALARRNLINFVMHTKPDYLAGWFHQKLARTLDQFLEDSVAGKSPRLIIEAPPRAGKSELTSVRFPAYAFGKHPDITFIATSHTADLASFLNREVQRVIDSEEYSQVFPNTSLWGKNIRTVADGSFLRNSDVFEIVNHKGIYKCAGVGGPITGKGCHIAIIDDPLKDAAEAASKTIRDGIWEWFKSTLATRCAPGGGILVIATRWHSDDLIGRLLDRSKKGGEQWQEFRFPAIAEEDEFDDDGTLLRREGEALHPERYPLWLLNKIKLGTEDQPGVGSRVWASLYQQRPSAIEGMILKREDWQFWKPTYSIGAMDDSERKALVRQLGISMLTQSWDIAVGGKESNDYTACTTLGVAKNRYYVLDVWKGQVEFPEAKRQVQTMFDKWHPHKVTVEGGGSTGGKAIIQELKRDTLIPFAETITKSDKVMRANLIAPTHESHMVYLPEGSGWAADFIESCSAFPNGKHDDDVDSFIMAMEEATHGAQQLHITPEMNMALASGQWVR